MTNTYTTILLVLLSTVCWAADGSQLKLRSIDDQSVTLDADNVKATALIFVTHVCPIANSYQPLLRRLQQEFAGQGIQFVEVYPVASITKETVDKHRQEFDITAQCVIDADRSIAKRVGAKVTPEAIVVDRHGKVLYRGRIDDQHAALGKKRPQPTQHDLANALKSIVADQPIATAETTAVGCIIRY